MRCSPPSDKPRLRLPRPLLSALLLGILAGCTLSNSTSHHDHLAPSDVVFPGTDDSTRNYQKLLQPWDEPELHELIRHPKRDKYRMNQLILRAAADRKPAFGDALAADSLRNDPYLQPALDAYDYQMSHDPAALQSLAAYPGIPGVYAMAYADEWSQTIESIARHESSVDGAMGFELATFWITREQLFPESFRSNLHRPEVRSLATKRLGKEAMAKLSARNRNRTR